MARRRRVKCDESKPVCNRCLSANRQCEWYNMRNGTTPNGNDSTAKQEISAAPQTSTVLRSPPSLALFEDSESISQLLQLIPKINSMSLAETLEKTVRTTTETYLSYLPQKLGQNKDLDSAVQCVAVTARKLWVRCSTAQKESSQDIGQKFLHFDKHDPQIISCYANALNNLQEALAGGRDATSTEAETLCTSALLCYLVS